MSDEIIEVYDENMNKIGKMRRDEAHESGAWHRTFHCWIVSGIEEGKVLFQKRGQHKKMFPNYLDITAAGHYVAGEGPQEGIREIFEELGIEVQFSELVPLGIKFDIAKVGKIINREFCDVFLLRKDLRPKEFLLNPDEVEGLVEMNLMNGLALFNDEVKDVSVKGIEWDAEMKRWNDISMTVGVTNIIPRIDPYYFKVFIMAGRLLRREKYLSI
ncbi:MAG: NUDIX domain-containing protein [Desulfobacteria bacterium]